jgi:chaperonin GroES
MKVFSAIYRRIYKSLRLEYKKVRRISSLYRTQEEYERVVDCPEGADVKVDYRDEDMDVVPISDTADISDTQRLMKAEGLNQLVGKGLNDKEIFKRYLEALQIPEPEKILEMEDEGPTMEQQMQQIALELQDRELKVKEAEVEAKIAETREKLINLRANSIKALAEAEAKEVGTQVDLYQAYIGDIIRLLEVQQGGVSGNNQGRVSGVEGRQPGNAGSPQGGGRQPEVPAGYDMQRNPAFG